jgi:segregation and condensation protein B
MTKGTFWNRMSLKAKLEAVIYAAEEPVTLAQLASLFAAEALEYKAALAEEAAAAAEAAEPLPLIVEDAEEAPTSEAGEAAEAAPTAEAPAEQAEQPTEATDTVADAIEDPAADAKQAARLRDREVKGVLRKILDELIASYEADERGVEIREIAGGYRMATKPSCHDAVRLFVKSLKPPLKLSLPALETLAVIAYKQPVTAPEVSEIRGVESGGVLGSLMARKLIATAGRKQVIGRPMLYKTTKEFLLRFGLKDLSELPSMEEFEKIAAVEIEEMEPAETAASDESASNLEETAEETALEATSPDEPSQQAETEAAPDATEESKQADGEVPGEENSNEEGGSEAEREESQHEEGEFEGAGEPEAEEAH